MNCPKTILGEPKVVIKTIAVMGVSEELLQKGYVKECIAALEGCISTYDFTRHTEIQLKILLRLSKILIKYTINYERARFHLENASMKIISFENQPLRMEIYANLAEVYQNLQEPILCKKILKKGFEESLSQLWKDFFRLRLISTLHYSKNDDAFFNFISEGEEEAHERNDFKMKLVYCLISSQISLQRFQMNHAQKYLKKSKETFEKFELNISTELKQLTDSNLIYLVVNYLMIESMRLIQINQFRELSVTIKSLEFYLHQLVKLDSKTKYAFEWMKPTWMIIISHCLSLSYYTCTGQMKNAQQKIDLTKNLIQKRFKPLLNFINSGYKFNSESNNETLILLSFDFFVLEYQIIGNLMKSDWISATKSINETKQLLERYPHLQEQYVHNLNLLCGIFNISTGKETKKLQKIINDDTASIELKAWAQIFQMISEIPTMNQQQKEKMFDILNSMNQQQECNSILGLSCAISLVKGNLCFSSNALNEALNHIKNCLVKNDNEIKCTQLSAQTLFHLGKVYWQMNDFVSSKKCFSTSFSFSEKIKDEVSQYHILNELTNVYSKIDEEIEQSQDVNDKNKEYLNKKEIVKDSITQKMEKLNKIKK
eukprot:gene76-4325_t